MNKNYVFPEVVLLPLYFLVLLRIYKLLLKGMLEHSISLSCFRPGRPLLTFAGPSYFLLLTPLGVDWGKNLMSGFLVLLSLGSSSLLSSHCARLIPEPLVSRETRRGYPRIVERARSGWADVIRGSEGEECCDGQFGRCEKMAQVIELLFHNHEDPSSDPGHRYEK